MSNTNYKAERTCLVLEMKGQRRWQRRFSFIFPVFSLLVSYSLCFFACYVLSFGLFRSLCPCIFVRLFCLLWYSFVVLYLCFCSFSSVSIFSSGSFCVCFCFVFHLSVCPLGFLVLCFFLAFSWNALFLMQ